VEAVGSAIASAQLHKCAFIQSSKKQFGLKVMMCENCAKNQYFLFTLGGVIFLLFNDSYADCYVWST
jgi:hypothetical protein